MSTDDPRTTTPRTPPEKAPPMSANSTTRPLADASATLVGEYDVLSALTHLCVTCTDVVGASAAALLVTVEDGGINGLELMAASSHAAADLELHQQQAEQGPCLETIATGLPVHAHDAAEVARRWPALAPTAAASGIVAVHAYPMRWRGTVLGGLNVFFTEGGALGAEQDVAAQAFADVATLSIVHSRARPRVEVLTRQVREALEGRTVVEQAKGVLAVQESLDPAEAFQRLLSRSRELREPLVVLAARAVERAQRGEHWDAGRG